MFWLISVYTHTHYPASHCKYVAYIVARTQLKMWLLIKKDEFRVFESFHSVLLPITYGGIKEMFSLMCLCHRRLLFFFVFDLNLDKASIHGINIKANGFYTKPSCALILRALNVCRWCWRLLPPSWIAFIAWFHQSCMKADSGATLTEVSILIIPTFRSVLKATSDASI